MSTTYAVPGLAGPVEILIDRWGVPHVYATSRDDVFVAQGFNAARDRLFQIDLWRRRGLGLLSEVFGAAYVEHDRAARLARWQNKGDAGEKFLAEEAEDSWIVGTVEEAVDQLRALHEAGCRRIMAQQLLHRDTGAIELIGRGVAPRVERF